MTVTTVVMMTDKRSTLRAAAVAFLFLTLLAPARAQEAQKGETVDSVQAGAGTLALVALAVVPLFVAIRHASFESKRWADSAFNPSGGENTGGDDDDE